MDRLKPQDLLTDLLKNKELLSNWRPIQCFWEASTSSHVPSEQRVLPATCYETSPMLPPLEVSHLLALLLVPFPFPCSPDLFHLRRVFKVVWDGLTAIPPGGPRGTATIITLSQRPQKENKIKANIAIPSPLINVPNLVIFILEQIQFVDYTIATRWLCRKGKRN